MVLPRNKLSCSRFLIIFNHLEKTSNLDLKNFTMQISFEKNTVPVLQISIVSSANQIYLLISQNIKQTGHRKLVTHLALGLHGLEIFLSVAFHTKKEESKQFSDLILCIYIYVHTYTHTYLFL